MERFHWHRATSKNGDLQFDDRRLMLLPTCPGRVVISHHACEHAAAFGDCDLRHATVLPTLGAPRELLTHLILRA
jgi:hypothetical protein